MKEKDLNFTQLDKSNYLKGLLIIARKDNQLAESEKQILKQIALKLGFAKDFYEETIKNLLYNEHIKDEPIKFTTKQIAESFISDGLKLAFSDKKIHGAELEWLKETASINSLDQTWFENEQQKVMSETVSAAKIDLKLHSII